MRMQKSKRRKFYSLMFIVALASALAYAQTTTSSTTTAANATGGVTSAGWWQNTAKNIVNFMRDILAAAFWGSLALLLMYAILTWIGPTKFTRLGAMYDFIDTVKGWLLAVFVISAGIVGLVAGISAITGAFGVQTTVNPAQVLHDLLVQPILQAFGISS
ncbi:MAG: hypothetical protein QXP98_01015 [Thermoproteus sp.]